jgi:hypothetical protein
MKSFDDGHAIAEIDVKSPRRFHITWLVFSFFPALLGFYALRSLHQLRSFDRAKMTVPPALLFPPLLPQQMDKHPQIVWGHWHVTQELR